jgi:hypothetical protein
MKIVHKRVALLLLLILAFMVSVTHDTPDQSQNVDSKAIHFHPSAETPGLNLSYTTRTILVDTPVNSGDTLAGDHVTLKAEWTPSQVNQSRLEVHAPAIPATIAVQESDATVQLDTRPLGNNATCSIISTAWLLNGSIFTVEFTDVYIGNYFIPEVEVTSPNGGETWTDTHNITWVASDTNQDDELLFDVLYSSDSGQSYDMLVSSTNLTWYEWDPSNLPQTDTYLVMVRVTDGIYFSSDISDSTFAAGNIIITTTTSPTTTPTTPTNGLDPRIVAFIVILLFTSGIMALVVYYAATKWF